MGGCAFPCLCLREREGLRHVPAVLSYLAVDLARLSPTAREHKLELAVGPCAGHGVGGYAHAPLARGLGRRRCRRRRSLYSKGRLASELLQLVHRCQVRLMVCRLVHRESLDRLLLLCAPRGFGHHRECRLQGCDGSDGQVLVLPFLDGGGQEIGVCFSRFRSMSRELFRGSAILAAAAC